MKKTIKVMVRKKMKLEKVIREMAVQMIQTAARNLKTKTIKLVEILATKTEAIRVLETEKTQEKIVTKEVAETATGTEIKTIAEMGMAEKPGTIKTEIMIKVML